VRGCGCAHAGAIEDNAATRAAAERGTHQEATAILGYLLSAQKSGESAQRGAHSEEVLLHPKS
jgi:hypothetical protein